jgi:nicotinamidase-related amidase
MSVGEPRPLPPSPTVLLLVDVINPFDFPEAKRLERSAATAALAIARLKARLAPGKVACIYANDNYGQWRSDFRDVLLTCAQRGGVSAEIASLLAPGPQDLVILKPRHSGFFATPLDLLLSQMHTKRLIIAGLAADICVQLTAMDANLRGYELWIPSDCTAAESPALKRAALSYMARVLKADVRPSSAVRVPAPAT